MDNRILELKCNKCVRFDKDKFMVSFDSPDNEKYTMTLSEDIPIGNKIRINSYYHSFQKLDDTIRISIVQSYFGKEALTILELFLADKFDLRNGKQISIYRDSNTLEVFKMIEQANKLKMNSYRLIRLKEDNLMVYKEAHICNGNYLIENWIHRFPSADKHDPD